MPIVRKAQSINNVAKKKDPAKVSVQSVREPALIKEMNDTSFGTLDASKDGLLMSYDSQTDKFVLVTADELLSSSVDDDDFYLNLKGFGGNSNIYLDDGDIFMYGNQNSNSEFKFTSSGTLHADGDVIAYSTTISSDRKLKENVRPIQSPMDKILHLEGVVFDWIEEGRPNDQIGFIAQEVEKIVPEVVTEVETLKTHSDTHKVVNYSAIVPILVEAVKIQQEEIERLKELAHPKCGIESFEGYAELVARIEKLENK